MIALANFTHDQFGEIRLADQNGEPWFIAKDVCSVLGILKHRDALSRLDEEERCLVTVDTPGGLQQTGAMNESGLYSLILRSQKPEAKAFKRWVTTEVLPSIRKTGSYSTEQTEEEIILQGYQLLQGKVDNLRLQLKEAAPKVEFYNQVTESESVCQLAVAAQVAGLPYGRNQLFQRLRADKILITSGDRHNLPYQKFIEQGLFEVKEHNYENPKTGQPGVSFVTVVTQKGLDWLIKRYRPSELSVDLSTEAH